MIQTQRLAILLLSLFLIETASGQDNSTVPEDLLTTAEKYNYRATAKSATTVQFIDRVAKRGKHISKFTFGTTVEGRPMVGAIVARPHVAKPDQLRNDKRLVVLIIGNIHSGECCGQEALSRMLRELLLQLNHPWLNNLVLLVVPNYNADGNDKRTKTNRPGQVGPAAGMGQRANAQGFDLNRDYIKLESPEARALVKLMTEWNPHCFIDCHTTNGSWHRYHLTYGVQHIPAGDPGIYKLMRKKMMPSVTQNLLKKKIDTYYYGNFDRKLTRWSTYGHFPRFGLDYVALRGRLSILSEAYSYITFRERIEATHAFVGECLNFLNDNADAVRKRLLEAERRVVAAGNDPQPNDMVPIRAALAPFANKVLVKGYDPPWQPRLKLDQIVPGVRPAPPGKPKDYRVQFYGKFVPTKSVRRPYAYLIPSKLKAVVQKLRQHGIKIDTLKKTMKLPVEVYRWESLQHSKREFQKHRMATAKVSVRKETREIPKGTHMARMAQPLGNLLIYLLEPESDDGLVAWNYFDAHFTKGTDYPVYLLMTTLP